MPAAPGDTVVVHGDNQVWPGGRLQVVLDFETVALAESDRASLVQIHHGAELGVLRDLYRHTQ